MYVQPLLIFLCEVKWWMVPQPHYTDDGDNKWATLVAEKLKKKKFRIHVFHAVREMMFSDHCSAVKIELTNVLCEFQCQ